MYDRGTLHLNDSSIMDVFLRFLIPNWGFQLHFGCTSITKFNRRTTSQLPHTQPKTASRFPKGVLVYFFEVCYKEYDGTYLGHYMQYFFWFFCILGIVIFSAWLSSFRSMITTTERSNLMFPTWLVKFIWGTINPLTIGISTENQWV